MQMNNLFRRYHDVILFAFAQQQVLAEEQIAARDRALEIGFANVVHIHTATFNIFPRLTFG